MQRSTLDQFGLVRLFTGDKVIVSLTVNERGEVIQDLVRVESPINPAPPAESKPEDFELRAVVKFFNNIRGYGFVTAKDIAEDSRSTVSRAGQVAQSKWQNWKTRISSGRKGEEGTRSPPADSS